MRGTADPAWDAIDQRLLSQSFTQRQVPMAPGTLTASRDVDGPHVLERGLVLHSLWLSSTAALPTTFTYQPYYYLKGVRYHLAPPRASTGIVVAAGVPFRLHAKERLDFDVPPGALLGVTVTRASGTLTNPTFHFHLNGG